MYAGVNKVTLPPVFAGEKLLKISCQGRIIANLPVGEAGNTFLKYLPMAG